MTAPARFRTTRRFLGPPWLVGDPNDPNDESVLVGWSLEIMRDAFVERLRLGLMARLPQQDPTGTPGMPDALAALGRDRRVVRGIDESAESYARRLLRWLDDRKTAGNPFSLMTKLAEYTGPLPRFRVVDARGNWYTRDPDGTFSWTLNTGNWNWDGPVGNRWARFWVIIYPNGLWEPYPNDWDDESGPNWGEGTQTWGSTATSEHVQTVRAIVADWKRQGSRCVNIIVAFDPDSFDPTSPEPDGLWGRWSKNVDGVQVPARLDTARYWDGV